jgi:hypothetical protein
LQKLAWLALNGNPIDRRRRGSKALQQRFGAAVKWEYRDTVT